MDTDHPGCEDISPTLPYLQRQTSLTRTLLRLDAVPPQLKIPEARLNSCGRVLTSIENFKDLELKEQQRNEKKHNQEWKRQKKVEKQASKQQSLSTSSEILIPTKVHARSSNSKCKC